MRGTLLGVRRESVSSAMAFRFGAGSLPLMEANRSPIGIV